MSTTFKALTGAQATALGFVESPDGSFVPVVTGTTTFDQISEGYGVDLVYISPFSNYTGGGTSYTNSQTAVDIVQTAGSGNTLAEAVATTTCAPVLQTTTGSGSSSTTVAGLITPGACSITASTNFISINNSGSDVSATQTQLSELTAMFGITARAVYVVQTNYSTEGSVEITGGFEPVNFNYTNADTFNIAYQISLFSGSPFNWTDTGETVIWYNSAVGNNGGFVYFVELGESTPSYIQVGQIGQGHAVPLPCVPCCNICGIVC
jgi:hypothetical protein